METASTVEEPTPTKAPVTTLMRTEIKSSSLKKNSKRVQNTSKKETEGSRAISQRKGGEKWWENRMDWIERFPFEPTHHPEITYDPDAFHNPREMQDLVGNHEFLQRFYESKLRYTGEFEQMYDIVKEEIDQITPSFSVGRSLRSESIIKRRRKTLKCSTEKVLA